MHISDSNFTTFKCDSVLPQIGPKISASFSLTQGFCDPKVTQVTINQALKRTMFWVETTCWYLIDTTLLFNKNIPPPTFFPNSTHLHHVGSFFPPSPSRKPPPPKKNKHQKTHPPNSSHGTCCCCGGLSVYPPGKYYRNRSTEVTYVPAKSRWLQTGFPHQSEVGHDYDVGGSFFFRGVLWEVAVRCIVSRFV